MNQDTEQTPVPEQIPPPPQPKPGSEEPRRVGTIGSPGWRIGAPVLGVLLYILLADAAVETFLSGSPLRWIVAGTVAVYLALSVILWRRLGWAAKAAASLLVLLGVLAVTAWRPEGLSHGVIMIRQPTSTVLAGVTGLAILLSGVLLVRWKFVRLAVRVGIAVLAAYGISAVGIGIVKGVPYPDLLHGRGLWDRLPFWLQGAFIGALVLVPVALLLQIVTGVARIRGVQLRMWAVQVLALSMSLAMAAAGVVVPAGSSRAEAPRPTTALSAPQQGASLPAEPRAGIAPAPTPQTRGVSATPVPQLALSGDELVRLLRAYQKLSKSVDRSSFDVKAAAARFPDVAAAFAFVRDQIANEVYPGVLRGPEGTLSAQAGNAPDKALLLGALLAAQKRQVQYAHCALDKRQALDRIRSMFARPKRSGEADLSQSLQAALVQEGISARRSSKVLETLRRSNEALGRTVDQTAQADLAVIRDALGGAGLRPTPTPTQDALLEEARQHYWVQVESDGRWKDLDPAFPTAQPGQTFCVVAHTYADLPADVYQTIGIKVRNEYVEGEKLRSATVLERRFAAADLHGRPIFFGNVPTRPSELDNGQIMEIRSFAPVLLIVGQSFHRGEEFRTGPGPASGPAGLFGQAFGGTEPQLGAQWLDFELTAPGRRSVASRAIVDTVDSVERAKGEISTAPDLQLVSTQLMQAHAIVISTGRLDLVQALENVFPRLDIEAIERVLAVPPAGNPSDEIARDIARNEFPVLSAQAFAFALASDRALSESVRGTDQHVSAFRDQPLIAIANFAMRRSGEKKSFIGGTALDVRNNGIRVVPDTREWAEQAFWTRTRIGLVDGALERYIRTFQAFRPASAPERANTLGSFSTSAVFELARSQGLAVRAYAGSAAVQALQREFSEVGGYRLASELSEGPAIVLPSKPVRFQGEQRLGLWTVDLGTGHVVALIDTGLRAGTDEQVLVRRIKSMAAANAEKMLVLEEALRSCIARYGPGAAACKAIIDQIDYTLRVGSAIKHFSWAVEDYFGLKIW